ncbi:hypothetical protein ELS19_11800 [Halogeometricum borinquense]|uniref:DUF2238 domain-containing protein n=1 Tax=Halogeometricum borinquense TaxID=60847 RepID=A0A482TE05_9EURY|nr:hypothetical protein [Halogeometricum borinquense]RYJ14566.1 hypothetical protein ELS19_11800 [Halogeometricum borinquense]
MKGRDIFRVTNHRLRDVLHITVRRQRQATRAMQILLGLMVVAGLLNRNGGVFVNALVGFVVTFLPGILERDHGIPMDAGLTLWITSAVFLHGLGTVELPIVGSPYASIPWWDHLTHALSASIVAAVGYSTARAIDLHTDAVDLPPRFMFVFILTFTLAFGVLWEVIEFMISVTSNYLGIGSVLTQYGLRDTMFDLLFDTAGAIVVAVWGSSQLSEVVAALTARLGRSST